MIPPSGLFHTSRHVHPHPYAETNDASVLELQSVLILYSDRPFLKRTQNSWEPEMVMSHVCVRGGVALTSLLSVSVRFGSDGIEW